MPGPELGYVSRTRQVRPRPPHLRKVGVSLRARWWGGAVEVGTCVTSQGSWAQEIAPSSLNSRRKAADTFSMAMMIINFKKFKSIPFSLKCEVC